jgi:hypothetical protein
MKVFLIGLVIFSLSGCAMDKGWHWEKANGDYQSFNMDDGQCRAQALAGTGGMVNWGTLMIMQSCMQGKGWYKVNNL